MQASSLIFLVIIAIWAAYFIQYWVRRREHLATARAVDRFSESMRLLELRSPAAEGARAAPSALVGSEPRSYAVSPARPAAAASRGGSDGETSRGADRERSRPGVFRRIAGAGRRVRGLVFLGMLVALTAVSALAALAFVPLWSVAIPGGLMLVAFVWLRVGARAASADSMRAASVRAASVRAASVRAAPVASRSDRRVHHGRGPGSQRPAPRRSAAGSARRQPQAVGSRGPSRRREPVSYAPVEPQRIEYQRIDELDDEPETEPVPSVVAREELFDIEATSDPLSPPPPPPQPAPVRYALVDEDDIPLTWDPVPVPRPTYTMKSRALRPDPEPAAVTPEAAFAPEAGHPAYRMGPERRVAGI